jgi:L-ribulose-5-phosphate 4-epimerase
VSEYIKFSFECRRREDLALFGGFDELKLYRQQLLQLGLIGMNSHGVGFGNLSVRSGRTSDFYITGTATAGVAELRPEQCAKVVGYDFDRNWIRYDGSVAPSSESLTHAAVYESASNVRAVIHCHDLNLWKALLNEAPITCAKAEYGTPEMAYEIMRLFRNSGLRSRKVLVMAGHEGGLLSWGENLKEAFADLIMGPECGDLVVRS